MLQLSPFVLPQIRIGALRMTTLNMLESPERLQFVRGLQVHLEQLAVLVARGVFPRADLESFYEHAFRAKLFTHLEWDDAGKPRLTRWEHAEDFVSFDQARLGLMFLDGRLRDEREMVYLPTGEATPAFGRLVARMAAGIRRDELVSAGVADEIDLDDGFVEMLIERGVLEEIDDPRARVSDRFRTAPGDRVTWLGHASMIYQSGSSTVWFDPLVPPRLRYTAEDLPIAFADDLALYTPPPDGPDVEQLTYGDLPPPDAVVLSHQEVDNFDLGLLMCLPESTPIVVPATRPGHPWDIDLAVVIERVLGQRRVIRLAHGESISFGDVQITATPFVGERPIELEADWNCFVVRGQEAAIALCNASAVVPEHAENFAELLGDRGPRAIVFVNRLYAGPAKYDMGFREEPNTLFAGHRLWSWYLPNYQWFNPMPTLGIASDLLRMMRDRCGLGKCFVYGLGGAPWLTFQAPHVHRHHIWNMKRQVHDRTVNAAREVAFDVPPLKIGVPFAL